MKEAKSIKKQTEWKMHKMVYCALLHNSPNSQNSSSLQSGTGTSAKYSPADVLHSVGPGFNPGSVVKRTKPLGKYFRDIPFTRWLEKNVWLTDAPLTTNSTAADKSCGSYSLPELNSLHRTDEGSGLYHSRLNEKTG